MHMTSPIGILVIAIVVLVLFGKGINAFKKGIDDGKADIAKDEATTSTAVAKDVTPAETKDQA